MHAPLAAPAVAGSAPASSHAEMPVQPQNAMPTAKLQGEAHPVTTSPVSLLESNPKDVSAEPARAPRALPEQAYRTISVVRNETLFGISMENYGRYDQQIVDVIREMNPGLQDPDHIKAGQKLRIPVVGQDSNLGGSAASSAAEVNKQ